MSKTVIKINERQRKKYVEKKSFQGVSLEVKPVLNFWL